MNKNSNMYIDMIADYTMLGVKKTGRNRCEVFVEYLEPIYDRVKEHICNLPEETFEVGDNVIAVFREKNGKLRIKDIYDIELHKFVVKDKVKKVYKERFMGSYKVKEKIG